jgi:rhodanese-related sulfurtransferase
MKKVTTLVILLVVCLTLSNTSFANFKINNYENASTNEESTQFISVDELKTKMAKKEALVVLDVRGADYDSSPTKIKGAIRIVPGELSKNLTTLPKDKMIITYCSCPTDGGSISAAKTLVENGFKKVYVLKGGWNAWNSASGQVENK